MRTFLADEPSGLTMRRTMGAIPRDGVARVQLHADLVGAAYNLLRLSRLQPLSV